MRDPLLRVRELTVAPAYDLVICTVGYEARAVHVSKKYWRRATKRIALGFEAARVLSYDANLWWYAQHGFELSEVSDDDVFEACRAAVRKLPEAAELRVLVDISSMTRARIAHIASALTRCGRDVTIDFMYTIARYSAPPRRLDPTVEFGPIADELAGWPGRPESPMVLILGLGYETDRALGTAEVLEPADLWLFRPVSPDPKYHDPVDRANAEVRLLLSSADREIEYRVSEPFDTFQRLLSLVTGINRDGRAILIPFGPKIFALCSVLVGFLVPETGVWRVSSGALAQPLQRYPSGEIVGLTVHVPGPSDAY